MKVVFPFHAGDASMLSNLLAWIKQLQTPRNHTALLVADSGVDWKTTNDIRVKALESFTAVEIISNGESVTGWPQGPNSLFLAAAKYCSENNIQPWLWMETDAVPLHRDWIDILALEYATAEKPFLGAIYPCSQPGLPPQILSGVAIYPSVAFNLMSGPMAIRPDVAFDVSNLTLVMQNAGHTNRIQHFWGETRELAPTFVAAKNERSPRNAFTLQRLANDAILFHRNKDGTLIDLLRERNGIKTSKPSAKEKSRGNIRIRRTGALGDVLCSTVVARKLWEQGFDVTFQAHASAHCILRRIPEIAHVEDFQGSVNIDLDGAYETDPQRKLKHFAQMFIERANRQLGGQWIERVTNFAPRMVLPEADRIATMKQFEQYPRPWVVICPRSNSWVNRTVPDAIWEQAARHMPGTQFWLAMHPAPRVPTLVDLNIKHFDHAINFLSVADLLVTVDTGPMHVAAALGTPVIAIEQASSPELHLSDQRDWEMIAPPLRCLNCQTDVCPIHASVPPCQQVDPMMIASAVNRKINGLSSNGVSCVIAIYKPAVHRLNRCLTDVLPQVDEIFVVADQTSMIPAGAMQHPNIKYLRMKKQDTGYGAKANYGFRHTSNPWVLLLNDDLYLAPDAVAKMREVAGIGVGMVSHELRYPNGTIQHGGTYRNPGDKGWGHMDWKATESRIKEPVEMENVCGASVLVRREAFYQAGGFDENVFLYVEDNILCLCIRRAGWKIMYTPHAKGIHEESQSTSVRQGIHNIMMQSNAYLGKTWGWYFELNKDNSMGRFE